MGKAATPRALPENEAKAVARMLRVCPQKLNLVAQLIRGKKVATALADLEFSQKRIARDVRKCLESAIANAENNHDLDVDDLVVKRGLRRQGARAEALPCPSPRSRRPHPETVLEPHDRGSRSRRRTGVRRPDGSESQPDRSSARHQPDLGFALVRRQGRVRAS